MLSSPSLGTPLSTAAAAAPAMEPRLPPPSRKVHVVYYLSRSGQLEHPHLLEVSISPTEGLYLRDVKKRLAMIRGRRLPSTFSWSYKRSYKNGYVWQDLCDDDLIFPAHGCEYVLKGSEIISENHADKCRHNSAFATQGGENQQELPQARCQESVASTKTNMSLKYSILDKPSEAEDDEYVARGGSGSISDSCSHITFEFGKAKSGNLITPTKKPVQSSRPQENSSPRQRFYAGIESSDEEVRSMRDSIPSKAALQVSMVENGTDAATQTDEENAAAQQMIKSSKSTERLQKPTELTKIDISSPPNSSSSATSPSPYASASAAEENPASSDKNERTQACYDTEPGTPSKQTSTRKSAGSHQDSASVEEPSPRPRSKHSGALSLLQFVSCGGLDIKEQILPMSLYLKSKGSQHPSTEQLCAVLYGGAAQSSRSWNPLGRKNSSKSKSCCDHASPGSVSEGGARGTKDGSCRTPRSLASEADVISIGRSSVSDRSTNVSRELDYLTESHAKLLKSSGEMLIKGSPRLISRELEFQMDSPKYSRVMSGEIKTLPLFVPKNAVNRRGLHSSSGGLSPPVVRDPKTPGSSNAPSGALSDREVRETVVNHGAAKRERAGYESMAQLWEELLAPKGDLKDGDQRLQHHGLQDPNPQLDWERTLQNAVDMSLPPVELLVLHECQYCGRKFKVELLKAHLKSCNAQKTSKNAVGKPPKPDANIYQRLLRASPPPAK